MLLSPPSESVSFVILDIFVALYYKCNLYFVCEEFSVLLEFQWFWLLDVWLDISLFFLSLPFPPPLLAFIGFMYTHRAVLHVIIIRAAKRNIVVGWSVLLKNCQYVWMQHHILSHRAIACMPIDI